jgi:hypothetical protein
MDNFSKWLIAQERHIQLVDQLCAEREKAVDLQLQKQYQVLFEFKERTKKLEEFSESLETTLRSKENVTKLLKLTNSANSFIPCGGHFLQGIGDFDLNNINESKLESTANDLKSVANQIEDISDRLSKIQN